MPKTYEELLNNPELHDKVNQIARRLWDTLGEMRHIYAELAGDATLPDYFKYIIAIIGSFAPESLTKDSSFSEYVALSDEMVNSFETGYGLAVTVRLASNYTGKSNEC